MAWFRGGNPEEDAWKEWVHAVVLTPGLEVVANVSLLGPAGVGDARVIGLVRTDCWRGGVVRVASGDVRLDPDGRRLRAGASEVRWDQGAWHIQVELPKEEVSVRLSLAPQATPASVARLPFGTEARVQWNVVPLARAGGRVSVAGETVVIGGAPAYVDHNHGRFAWGEDFVWEWGAFLPDSDAPLGPAVFSRLLDARRHRLRAAGLMTWADGRYDRFYGDRDTRFALEGRWQGERPPTFPREMTAAVEVGAVGVPARMEVGGAGPGHADEVELRFDHAARLAVPSDRDPLGTVVIWELTGPAERRATRPEGVIRARGRGIVELVRVR